MYVNPFWCGVAATIVAEIVFVIGVCIIAGLKNKEDK